MEIVSWKCKFCNSTGEGRAPVRLEGTNGRDGGLLMPRPINNFCAEKCFWEWVAKFSPIHGK